MSHFSSLLQDVFCWQAKLLVYVHNAVAAIFEFITRELRLWRVEILNYRVGRGLEGEKKYDCLIALFIWEMPQALQYTPLAIIQTSCFICLNIYTKHFFTGTLPKLS